MLTTPVDNMNFINDQEIKAMLGHEDIYYSDKIIKVRQGLFSSNQERVILITDQAVYNVTESSVFLDENIHHCGYLHRQPLLVYIDHRKYQARSSCSRLHCQDYGKRDKRKKEICFAEFLSLFSHYFRFTVVFCHRNTFPYLSFAIVTPASPSPCSPAR